MTITPISATRVSDLLVSRRLLAQLQADQSDIFRIQNQLSSGRRIAIPSEDVSSSIRATGLQRLISRKSEVQVNLASNLSFLTATDSAIAAAPDLLLSIKDTVLSVIDTPGQPNRLAAIQQIEAAVGQLVDIGNHDFRGRRLFAGSRTQGLPFAQDGPYVAYRGNENVLKSFGDVDLLFETSVHGAEVFGAISEPVVGSIDLNPVLTDRTRVAELRGGAGVSRGSVAISDGATTSIVDLSKAETVADLVRIIEANPPEGRQLTVTRGPSGLTIAIDQLGGGSLTIREVAGGSVASELGILRELGTAADPIESNDLDPRLTLTTPLQNILGSRATALLASAGPNNDILVEALERGDAFNGVSVQLVNDSDLQAAPGLTKGNETAQFDTSARAARTSLNLGGADHDLILTAQAAGKALNNVTVQLVHSAALVGDDVNVIYDDTNPDNKTLTIEVNQNVTTIGTIAGRINAEGTFAAASDESEGGVYDPGAVVASADLAITANTGNSGGDANTLYVNVQAGLSTANDVVRAINDQVPEFSAQLAGKDSDAVLQAGTGVVSLGAIAGADGGAGFEFDQQSGIQILNGGQTHTISFASAETVEDLLNILNGSAAGVLAELNEQRNGINVRSRISGADFAIGENGGTTATELGIRSLTRETSLSEINHGAGVDQQPGADFTITRNDGSQFDIDISSAETIGDVLDLIESQSGVTARLAAVGNGLELVDDDPVSGQSLEVTRVGHSFAAQNLGFVPRGKFSSDPPTAAQAASATLELAGPDNDIVITAVAPGGGHNDIDIVLTHDEAGSGDVATVAYDSVAGVLTIGVDPGVTTAATVIDEIQLNLGAVFDAQLATGAEPGNTGAGPITEAPGVIGVTAGGTAEVLATGDINPHEVRGVFNTLLRLGRAIEQQDDFEIQRAVAMLEEDFDRLVFTRAEIGARQQGLDVLSKRLDSELIEIESVLSEEIDVDFTEAVSELAARQTSLQASLQMAAQALRVTLLDFL